MTQQPKTQQPKAQEHSPTTRRHFLGLAGLASASIVLTGVPAAALNAAPVSAEATSLNFILNLKYLQAAYYLSALGRLDDLTAAGGDASKVTRPATLPQNGMTVYSSLLTQYFGEMADDEVAQVRLLRRHLCQAAHPQPQLDLADAFSELAKTPTGQKTAFNPFENELLFLQGAALLEDVTTAAIQGVTAQGLAAPLPNLLATDARHAGMIRLMLHQQAGAAGIHLQEVMRDNLLGHQGGALLSTPRQVADVLLGAGRSKGGFFPQGLSGPFQSLSLV